jgi:hypothetical protein
MNKWKIPAIAAGIGALISLIAGLAGGNPFGRVVLRMLFSILLAGALGAAIQYVLRRFLPELGSKAEGESAPSVDIVIEDELPLGEPGPEARAVAGAPPLFAEVEQPAFAGREPAFAALEQEAPLGREPALAAVEMPEEREPALAEAVSEEQFGPLETLAGPEEEMPSEGSLESLPDMGGLGPSASAGGTGRFRGELAEAQVDSLVKGQDPAILAKAVRTFLRKDQEG